MTEFLCHGFEQCVQIAQFADIGTHGYDAGPEFLDRSVERLLVATRNRYPGAFFLEESRGSQSDSAAATCD
jgi:hypothetical protein